MSLLFSLYLSCILSFSVYLSHSLSLSALSFSLILIISVSLSLSLPHYFNISIIFSGYVVFFISISHIFHLDFSHSLFTLWLFLSLSVAFFISINFLTCSASIYLILYLSFSHFVSIFLSFSLYLSYALFTLLLSIYLYVTFFISISYIFYLHLSHSPYISFILSLLSLSISLITDLIERPWPPDVRFRGVGHHGAGHRGRCCTVHSWTRPQTWQQNTWSKQAGPKLRLMLRRHTQSNDYNQHRFTYQIYDFNNPTLTTVQSIYFQGWFVCYVVELVGPDRGVEELGDRPRQRYSKILSYFVPHRTRRNFLRIE